MKLTTKNKHAFQFLFSNPHGHIKDFGGVTREQSDALKARLQSAYGEDWFRFFLALKPSTLNAKIGE